MHCLLRFADSASFTTHRSPPSLRGGGAPFEAETTTPNNQLRDRRRTPVRMLGDVAASFAQLHRRMQAGEPLLVGVASRSDEPDWARECLRKFIVAEGVSMMDVVTDVRRLCPVESASSQLHAHRLPADTQPHHFHTPWFSGPVRDLQGQQAGPVRRSICGRACVCGGAAWSPDRACFEIYPQAYPKRLLSVGLPTAAQFCRAQEEDGDPVRQHVLLRRRCAAAAAAMAG